ncbi:hypothetical protein [Acidithiobacillus ferrivorans]|nr:hypothetical protein [Acidithiobacillus ferrivorans]
MEIFPYRIHYQQGLDVLLIEAPPSGADWQAVSDRLTRAASAHTAFRF